MNNYKVNQALKTLSIMVGLPFTIWLFFINWKIALCVIMMLWSYGLQLRTIKEWQ